MRATALAAVSLVVVLLAYGPLLLEFGVNLWEKPYYQHFPFVLLASGWLFWTRLEPTDDRGATGTGWWSIAAYIAAWLLLAMAYLAPSPMLAAASFILLLGGWASSLTRRLGCRFPLGPWMLLWLVIPPPLEADRRLIESLQRISSQLASSALDLIGVNHLMDGNALVLPAKQLFVDEACSGIISVISIVACSAIYAVWRRRGAAQTALLMAAGAGWATLLNVVRITAIALAEVWRGLDWTEGTPHTLVALAAFAMGLVALVATDWLLRAVLAEIQPRWEQLTAEPMRFGAPLAGLWDRVAERDAPSEPTGEGVWPRFGQLAGHGGTVSMGIVPVLAFAGLGATQLAALTQDAPRHADLPEAEELVADLVDGVMPKAVAGLTLADVKHEHRSGVDGFAEHSVIFTYRDDLGRVYQASCDFPYAGGWHELATCYQGIGWRVDERRVQQAGRLVGAAEGQGADVCELELTKPDGAAAYVAYCAWFQDGEAARAPRDGLLNSLQAAFSRRAAAVEKRQSFQAQVLVVRSEGVADRDRRLTEELLLAARQRFLAVVISD